MATNWPQTQDLLDRLHGADLTGVPEALLARLLESSARWVQDQARTFFDGIAISERRDGNGTNGIATFVRPVTSVSLVKVELPVLALTRTYTTDEVKVYRWQGRLTIFTFKLAAEHVSLHLDQQVYGNLLPRLPQCVLINYTGGFPVYDPDDNTTTLDGVTFAAGDLREPREVDRIMQLQEAALCDAAASYLAQTAGLKAGVITSVSFDGFSKATNSDAYGPQVQSLISKRDELLGRAKGTGFHLTSL